MSKKDGKVHINMRKIEVYNRRNQIRASGVSPFAEESMIRKILEKNKALEEKVKTLKKRKRDSN